MERRVPAPDKWRRRSTPVYPENAAPETVDEDTGQLMEDAGEETVAGGSEKTRIPITVEWHQVFPVGSRQEHSQRELPIP